MIFTPLCLYIEGNLLERRVAMNALLEKTDKPVKRPNDEEYMISMVDCVFKAIIQDLKFRSIIYL